MSTSADVPSDMLSRIGKFVELAIEKRDLEARLAAVKVRMAEMEEPLTEQMGMLGVQNLSISGRKVYKRTSQYIRRKGNVAPEELHVALAECGYGYLVKEQVNANSLQSAMKELLDAEQPIPSKLQPLLHVYEETKLVVMK